MRPDAAWCGQCYADFRPPAPTPAPEPVPAAVPTVAAQAAYGVPAGDPLTQPLLDFLPARPEAAAPEVPAQPAAVTSERTWPCGRCASPNPLTASACSVCGTPFLAEVGGDARRMLVLPLVGDLGSMSRGKRIGLALALVGIVLTPLALITLLLTGSPPADKPTSGDSQVVTVNPQP